MRARRVLVLMLVLAARAALRAQEAPRSQLEADARDSARTSARLFDAVVETYAKNFWDKERLAAIGWEQRAAEVRQSVVDAPSLEEAARRINALLGELKTSHTGLLTPDDVDYYILLAVFSAPRHASERSTSGSGARACTYAGIGIFSVRIDGRDFVDAVLEGSPAERAGLKVGDEIVSVDGAPYHPIRSFRGKVGQEVRRRRPAHARRPDRDARASRS